LYGFARYADEIVDDLSSTLTPAEKAEVLGKWSSEVLAGLKSGTTNDAVGKALIDTVQRFAIPHQHFIDFLHSMEMDLTITRYETYEDLYEYVYGSAAVIGLEMVPILGGDTVNSLAAAKDLGVAFQLANFIRDVAEDLDRGRIYLPLDELAEHGVTPEMLNARKLTPEIISALKFQISRVRQLQKAAEPGIALLDKTSRPCIRAASELYCGIVDEVEKMGYDIFNKRAKTSTARRARVAGRAYVEAVLARIG
jgi:phytoene synthase